MVKEDVRDEKKEREGEGGGPDGGGDGGKEEGTIQRNDEGREDNYSRGQGGTNARTPTSTRV